MSLQQLQGVTTQNAPAYPHHLGLALGQQPLGTGNLAGLLQPSPPSVGPYPPSGIASVGGQLPQLPDHNFHRVPLPDYGMAIGFRPQPPLMQLPDYSGQFEKFGETLGGYSSQFDKFGEQLGGLGEQMTGYQDALGSFNEQMGGMGKQFETISNRLDSVDKGLGSLGNQIASLENMQKAQPQEVRPQPQRPAFNPFNPFGFGGLGSLFGRRY
jgi:hypothetical protein